MAGPTSSSRQYNYKKPSSFNFVTLLLVLGALTGAYFGWKFGPVYWNRFKAEEILREGAAEASNIRRMTEAAQRQIEEKVIGEMTDRLDGRGIGADQQLSVYFEGNYGTLNADYFVTVKHLWGKRTVVHVHRSVDVAE